MIFTEGTLTMPSIGMNVSSKERVKQVQDGLPEVDNFETYIPVGNAVNKLKAWQKQGLEICYLTSRKLPEEVAMVRKTLKKYDFPDGEVFFRNSNEQYKDVAERVLPDILIEDDCESIGGEIEMTYPHISPELKKKIKSITVREFGGIDHLPDKLF